MACSRQISMGSKLPTGTVPAPLVGTQDDDIPYGATVDALNIWDLSVVWKQTPIASITFRGSFETAPFDSNFPCGVVAGSLPPDGRDCLPEPGITDGSRFLDILSYRSGLLGASLIASLVVLGGSSHW